MVLPLLTTLLLTLTPPSDPAPTRKALVIGIDRYDAQPAPVRPLKPLRGAVADAQAMERLLRETYRFEVRLLANEGATRDGILAAIQGTLVRDTRPGDIRVFYFSGYGAQVVNLSSPEPDKLDDTLVPFDAPAGARDLRDKELNRALGAVIDAGGVLTVILDACNSGSSVRGKGDARRGMPKQASLMDPRAVDDPSRPVPLDGALVLSAAQEFEYALEVETPQPRGAFTWALVDALSAKDAPSDPARRVFLRMQQKLRDRSPQNPVMIGSLQRQRATVFDAAPGIVSARAEVNVRKKDGRLVVDAGSALGLGPGSILRATDGSAVQLEVTRVESAAVAIAAVREGDPEVAASGGTFEVVEWGAIPGSTLLVHVGDAAPADDAAEWVADLQVLRGTPGVQWVEDPSATRPTHWITWENTKDGLRWIVYGPDGRSVALTRAELRAWAPGPQERPAHVFASVPPSRKLTAALRAAFGRPGGLVQIAPTRSRAHYVLVGRGGTAGVEYAWLRAASAEGGPARAMPARTGFASAAPASGPAGAEVALRDAAERLARSYGWLTLQSPPASDARFPYELVLRRSDGQDRRDGDRTVAGETYGLVLRADAATLARGVQRRWVYVFAMDSAGTRELIFPVRELGDVGNLVPRGDPAPEVVLSRAAVRVSEPFGTDTFFLLASDSKLPDPEVLNEDGVRTRGLGGRGADPLPLDLIAPVTRRTRGGRVERQAADWTIRRISVTSGGPP
jgi:caspase domain-containing protein